MSAGSQEVRAVPRGTNRMSSVDYGNPPRHYVAIRGQPAGFTRAPRVVREYSLRAGNVECTVAKTIV
jgi:hypothetical protein